MGSLVTSDFVCWVLVVLVFVCLSDCEVAVIRLVLASGFWILLEFLGRLII